MEKRLPEFNNLTGAEQSSVFRLMRNVVAMEKESAPALEKMVASWNKTLEGTENVGIIDGTIKFCENNAAHFLQKPEDLIQSFKNLDQLLHTDIIHLNESVLTRLSVEEKTKLLRLVEVTDKFRTEIAFLEDVLNNQEYVNRLYNKFGDSFRQKIAFLSATIHEEKTSQTIEKIYKLRRLMQESTL